MTSLLAPARARIRLSVHLEPLTRQIHAEEGRTDAPSNPVMKETGVLLMGIMSIHNIS